MRLENTIMSEFIELYKESRCLWDPREVGYTDREVRMAAYDTLLEKYKELQEDATILDVKKKIENIRATYRREHRKVLISRLNGDLIEHVPHLWYYENMLFLNEVADFGSLEKYQSPRDRIQFEHGEPRPKVKRKREVSTVFLSDNDDMGLQVEEIEEVEEHNDDDEDHYDSQQSNVSVKETSSGQASQSFGTTVGLQLQELDSMQRVIAEKLISEVIFNGRLNKLTIRSSLNL